MQLKNKRVLITGAGKGLGQAIAQRLAGAGMDVVVHCQSSVQQGRQTVEQLKQKHNQSLLVQADLRDFKQVDAMLEKIHSELGPLDVLINNAAVFLPTPLEQFDESVWRETFEVNVFAPALLSRRIGLQMKTRGSGKIVNILDIAADKPFASYAGYCASKAALANLTKSLAKALAPEVQVNGVAPGIMDWPEFFSEAQKRLYVQNTPLGRTGAYDDVAGTVLFLIQEAAFITGEIINVDGGRSL